MNLLLIRLLILLLLTLPAGSAFAAELEWRKDLAEARVTARRTGKPLLIRVGSESCPYCRMLEQTMTEPDVIAALEPWILVDLRLETASDVIVPLAIGPIPALRAQTPLARTVAAQEGAIPAEDLLKWLHAALESVKESRKSDELLLSETELTDAVVRDLVPLLGVRDPSVREAALRRLQLRPGLAAVPVAVAFQEGSLASQLTALELLEGWRAPVVGIDPWQPETRTRPRLQSIAEWAAARAAMPDDDAAPAETPPSLEQQLVRYLTAPEDEAHAIRERLARFGRLILPQVYAALSTTENSDQRSRLTWLRYRLVASERAALAWPGGLERLSAADLELRQQAAEELAAQATAADAQLLLEVFSDPAPLIREIALQALHTTGSTDVGGALLRLLQDPNPNVQAAVLNQLAESPGAEVVPELARYVKDQTDADLVGHAVRVLAAAPGPQSVEALTDLLDHEDWQVRAATVDALSRKASSESEQTAKADILVALLGHLEDPDAFVVGRVVQAFARADLPLAIDPLVKAAQAHPELGPAVVVALSSTQNVRMKALPALRDFCQSPHAAIRAAAISAVCSIDPDASEEPLRQMLADAEPAPRIAAIEALLSQLRNRLRTRPLAATHYRPHPSSSSPRAVSALHPENVAVVPDDSESEAVLQGPAVPEWCHALLPLLEPLLESEVVRERVVAGVALVACGQRDEALPLLTNEAASAWTSTVAQALPWLPRADQVELFQQLTAQFPDPDTADLIVEQLTLARDPRCVEQMWSLLQRPEATGLLATAIRPRWIEIYTGQTYYWNRSQPIPSRQRLFLTEDLQEHLGPAAERWERLLAYSVLLELEPAAARTHLETIELAEYSDEARGDLAQICLASATGTDAAEQAIAGLQSSVPDLKAMAVRFLALGREGLGSVAGVPMKPGGEASMMLNNNQRWQAEVPAGVTADLVRPLIDSSDEQTAFCARYLLVLLGDADSLAAMLEHWRKSPEATSAVTQLVYRAAAVTDDPTGQPVLESLFAKWQADEESLDIRDFYWTIRSMTSPEALRLRKQIRDEVGMDRLR